MLRSAGDRDEPGAGVPMLPRGGGGDLANGGSSSGGAGADLGAERTIADEVAAHTSTPVGQRKSVPLFERASSRWWNPQFASALLESQYWKCGFPQLRDRFRSGLIYICVTCGAWICYHAVVSDFERALYYQLTAVGIMLLTLAILVFTFCTRNYQRFYLPTSFLCTFLVCVVTLLVFSLGDRPLISPLGTFATSVEVILLVYTVIPLPLYLCIVIGVVYSSLFEILSMHTGLYELQGVKLALHLCVHLLGVHLFILTQVRQRKTFLKVGQSLMARKDLEIETQFKDHMIQSVMPKKVADELLKETSELRRPSATGAMNINTGPPNVRKFRPFTMNLMTDVSILFADIAGFTKMSSNKSADELVNLLNDLFGRFDVLCGKCSLEKISTLGECKLYVLCDIIV